MAPRRELLETSILLLLFWGIRLLVFVAHLYFPKFGGSIRWNAREGPSYAGLQAICVVRVGSRGTPLTLTRVCPS